MWKTAHTPFFGHHSLSSPLLPTSHVPIYPLSFTIFFFFFFYNYVQYIYIYKSFKYKSVVYHSSSLNILSSSVSQCIRLWWEWHFFDYTLIQYLSSNTYRYRQATWPNCIVLRVRFHISCRGERNIPYKGVETSP